ncbi:MAG: hypothetical protein [Podoviridae sp. ctLUJ1]|nr:MAG: hypothetical protein [Podoviridae sp. ctLUJ1]
MKKPVSIQLVMSQRPETYVEKLDAVEAILAGIAESFLDDFGAIAFAVNTLKIQNIPLLLSGASDFKNTEIPSNAETMHGFLAEALTLASMDLGGTPKDPIRYTAVTPFTEEQVASYEAAKQALKAFWRTQIPRLFDSTHIEYLITFRIDYLAGIAEHARKKAAQLAEGVDDSNVIPLTNSIMRGSNEIH